MGPELLVIEGSGEGLADDDGVGVGVREFDGVFDGVSVGELVGVADGDSDGATRQEVSESSK